MKRRLLGVLVAIATAMVVAAPATADELTVVDGDTLRLGKERIRLEGIDAPEIGEPACLAEAMLGEIAAIRLSELIEDAEITILRIDVDKHGRTLARVYADDVDVGEQLVLEGVADYWLGRQVDWCRPY